MGEMGSEIWEVVAKSLQSSLWAIRAGSPEWRIFSPHPPPVLPRRTIQRHSPKEGKKGNINLTPYASYSCCTSSFFPRIILLDPQIPTAVETGPGRLGSSFWETKPAKWQSQGWTLALPILSCVLHHTTHICLSVRQDPLESSPGPFLFVDTNHVHIFGF